MNYLKCLTLVFLIGIRSCQQKATKEFKVDISEEKEVPIFHSLLFVKLV